MICRVRSTVIGIFVVALLAGFTVNSGQAAIYTWIGANGGTWASSGNWSSSVVGGVPGATDTALFLSNGHGTSVSLGGNSQNVGVIQFSNSSTSSGFLISNGTLDLSDSGSINFARPASGVASSGTVSAVLDLLGAATFNNYNASSTANPPAGSIVISGSLVGAGALTVTGTAATARGGIVILSGNATGYTGPITVASLAANVGGFFGNTFGNASSVTWNNGLWQSTSPVSTPMIVNSGATTFSSPSIVQPAPMTVNSGGTLTLSSGNGNAPGYTGPITGAGNLLLLGAATGLANDCTFSGTDANTLSGNITISQGRMILSKPSGTNAVSAATVNVGLTTVNAATEVLWNASNQVNGASVFTLNSSSGTRNGQIWMQGNSDTIAGLQDTGGQGTAIVQNQGTSTSSGVLIVSPSAGAIYTFGGIVRDGTTPSGQGMLSFGVSGAGQQILTGAETYSGTTSVNGGTLTVYGSLNNANIQVNSGTFNGSGLINFNSGNLITVGSAGTFDASGGMQLNVFGLLGTTTFPVMYHSGSTSFVAPSPLTSWLTPASQIFYSLNDSAGTVQATANPQNAWNIDSDGVWSSSSNWSMGFVPNASGTVASFLGAITQPRTVTLDENVTVGVMVFSNTNHYTIQDLTNTNTITLDNGGGSATVAVALGSHTIAAQVQFNNPVNFDLVPSSSTLTISGNISGFSTGLNLSGSGTLFLSGTNNTFTGPVTIASGKLIAAGGSALNNMNAVNVAAGATFALNAASDNQTIGSLNCDAAGSVILLNGGTLNVASNLPGNVFGLTGAGTVFLTAAGPFITQTLANNSAFTGSLTITGGSLLTPLTGASAFGTTSGTTTLNSVNWAGAVSTNQSFYITGGTSTFATGSSGFSGNIGIDPTGDLVLNTGNGNQPAVSGVISGGGVLTSIGGVTGGNNEFSKTTISGSLANTFTGTTFVQQGTLLLQKSASVNAIAGPLSIGKGNQAGHVELGANEQINPSVVVTFNNGGFGSDLRLEGFQETLGGLVGLLGNGAMANYGASASTLTIATAGNNDFGGYLLNGGAAALAVNVNGTGVQSFSGTDTYTGGTTVAGSATLSINGVLIHANITVNGGTLNGFGTIAFNPGEKIVVGAAGTFDASAGLTWDLTSLGAAQANLLDYTSGGAFLTPGSLSGVLTPASQAEYTITSVGNVVQVLTTNTWNVDSDGTWSNPNNWQSGNVPNGPGVPVNFGNVITAPRTVTLDIPVTVSSMLFSGSAQYTLLDTTGTNTITFNYGAVDSAISVTAGSHVINAPVVLGGNGTLDVSITPSTGTLTIAGNMSESTAGAGVLHLVAGSTGKLLLTGSNSFTGGVTVNSGILNLNGSLATANIHLTAGTLNGSGTINFQTGNEIVVGAAGTFDASGGMHWNIAGLTGTPINLLDFTTSGAMFISPTMLNGLLTPASSARYMLSTSGSIVEATLIPNNWNVDNSATWSSSASWLGGNVPNGVGAPATFGSIITSPRTVTVDIPVTVGSISFANTNQYTLLDTTGTNSITLNNAINDTTIAVTKGSHLINAPVVLGGNGIVDVSVTPSTGTLTISGIVSEATSGTGVMNVAAASTGTVLLNGSNSFMGGVNIKGGTLIAAGGSALAGTVPVSVASGATFALSAATDNQTIGALNSTGSSAVISPNGGTLNVAFDASSGTAFGVFGLTGAGTVILTASSATAVQNIGANGAFTGNLTINNGIIGAPFGTANAFGPTGGTVTVNNATLSYGGVPVNESFNIRSGTTDFENIVGGYINGNISVSPSATFIAGTGGGNSGIINGVISGGGNFTFVGGGFVHTLSQTDFGFEFSPTTLTGTSANTLSGPILVELGTLALNKSPGVTAIAGNLTIGYSGYSNYGSHVFLYASEQINPTSVVSFATTGSDLRLNGFNETVGGLASTLAGTTSLGNGTVGDFGTTGSTLTINATGANAYAGALLDGSTSGALALYVTGAGTQTISGHVSLSGGVHVNSGTLILSGSNNYTGGTSVIGGELIATSVNAIPNGSNLNVGPGSLSLAPVVEGSPSAAPTATPVPEPGTIALVAAGMIAAAAAASRRRIARRRV